MIPREGAQRPRATLNYNYTIPILILLQDPRDTKGTGGLRTRGGGGVEKDTRGTGGHKGGSQRHQEDRRVITGGSERAVRP
jgi:hypothetical protein